MRFYKVIKDNSIVTTGFSFRDWNDYWKQLQTCELETAIFARANNGVRYHDAVWMEHIPEEAKDVRYETATVAIITETEYDDINATLESGETVELPDENVSVNIEEYPEEYNVAVEEPPEEDRPLTISEMRKLILEQQNVIKMLTECMVQVSEVLYK